jgi:hypothetical protein
MRTSRIASSVAAAGAIAAAWAAAPAPALAPAGPHEYSCPLFPASNPLNQDISHAPVDPRSGAYIASIGLTGHLHPDFGTNPSYGIPYTVVGSHQPKVPIDFTAYGEESNPGPSCIVDRSYGTNVERELLRHLPQREHSIVGLLRQTAGGCCAGATGVATDSAGACAGATGACAAAGGCAGTCTGAGT